MWLPSSLKMKSELLKVCKLINDLYQEIKKWIKLSIILPVYVER